MDDTTEGTTDGTIDGMSDDTFEPARSTHCSSAVVWTPVQRSRVKTFTSPTKPTGTHTHSNNNMTGTLQCSRAQTQGTGDRNGDSRSSVAPRRSSVARVSVHTFTVNTARRNG